LTRKNIGIRDHQPCTRLIIGFDLKKIHGRTKGERIFVDRILEVRPSMMRPKKRSYFRYSQKDILMMMRPYALRLIASTLSLSALITASPCFSVDSTVTPDSSPLPVKAVTLFSSGVSYTLREGEVSDNATIPLTFQTAQINDILKSLVLLDSKGTVQPAIYAAKDPIGRTLKSFAVDVSEPTSRANLLNKLRGAKVSVEAGGIVLAASTQTPKVTLIGQIVGVEQKEIALGGEKTTTVDFLTIIGDAGLQSVRLDEVSSVRFLEEKLNREFREALSLLSSHSDDRRRQVVLHFDGKGKRTVRVGYIAEAPLWKISYRLLLSGANDTAKPGEADKPYIQGWALVENTTDEDWNKVSLSLVSGRPISFIQDMYQPLYLPRPVVPPDVIASPYPQLAEGNLDEDNREAKAGEVAAKPVSPPISSMTRAQSIPPAVDDILVSGTSSINGRAAARTPSDMTAFKYDSVAAQAAGEKAGEMFAYNISTPVTLPRQQAAMIPVIAQNIDGEKVSLYNPDNGQRFPLNAVRVKNNTTLHLKGGPVTLFDGGTYAGDARMEDIPPGDSRLITYAIDLSVEGDRQGKGVVKQQTTFSLKRSVLILTRLQREETIYTLKNKADQTRKVLVEHPYNASQKLIQPAKAEERTSSLYRFAVSVPPGKSEKLTVTTDQPISQTISLFDGDIDSLGYYVTNSEVPENIKTALREIVQRRKKVTDLQQQAALRDSEIAGIVNDQQRIRKNMEALDRTSALYKRYVTTLDQQENRIQNARSDANRLRSASAAAERDLRGYLDKLEIP
jgi:hypothetical protein